MKTLVVAGRRIVVTDADLVGAGGEALVHALPDGRVAKIFHEPTPLHEAKVRALAALAQRLPCEVVVPETEVHDESGAFVGFAMQRVPAGYVPLCELLRRPSFAAVDLASRAALWLSLRGAVAALHRLSIVVGDLSDQNVFVDPGAASVRIIDADSFQIGDLWCPVQTEAYTDPLANGAGPLTAVHDLYALHVLAVRLLLGVHPYGGTHAVHTTIAARAKAGLFVADPGVQYPDKVAQPPLVVGRALLDALGATFRVPSRPEVPTQLFQAVVARARVCDACGMSAVFDAGACPRCAAVAPPPKHGERVDDGLEVRFLFGWVSAMGATVAAVEVTPEGAVVHALVGGAWRRLPGVFDARARCVLLTESSIAVATGGIIEVWDLARGERRTRTTTELAWDGPIVGRAGHALVRCAGARLLSGDLVLGRQVERLLGDVVRDQTRLFSSDLGARVVAATRLGRQLALERFDPRGRAPLPLPALELGESLLDLDVLDDGASTLCLRQTRLSGANQVRVDLFGANGKLAASSRVAESRHPARQGVRGRVFRGAILLHPTSLGLVRESIVHGGLGDLSIVDGTEGVVDEASLLATTPRGLAVATAGRLEQLKPRA